MTDQPMKLVIDVANGTQEYVPLNEEELAQLELDKATADAERAEREAAEAAKANALASAETKLAQLGLNTDEIQALLGK